MVIFCVFFNLVIGELCCFEAWTDWQQSSVTCGQVCLHRQRDAIFGLSALAASECNDDHVMCPWVEWEHSSCQTIDCREWDFKVIEHD